MAVTDQGGAKKRKPGSKIDDINDSVSQAFKGFKNAMPLEDTSSSRFFVNKALAPKKSLGSIVNVGKKSQGASDSWGDPVEPSRALATQPTPAKGDTTPLKVTPKQEKELKKDANKLLNTLAGKEPSEKPKDASKDPSSGLSKDFVSGAVALLPMILGGLFGGEDGLAAGAEGTKSYIDTKTKLDAAANEVDLANKKLKQDNDNHAADVLHKEELLKVEKSKLDTPEEQALKTRKTEAEIGLLGAQTSKARAEALNEGKEKVKAGDAKKLETITDIEDRKSNILDNISLLEKQIDDKGTWEALGSHNQDFDRRVDQIATDMAKLMDPKSVARPAEVELVKQNLVKSGFSNSNSTAKDVLAGFRKEIDSRTENAYKVRGLDLPQNIVDAKKSRLEALRAQFKR
jgi:hypothetical protein